MISGTNGMNKYICKYIVKIDESNLLRIESHPNKSNTFKINEQVRTNTKVTSSKIVEDKANTKSSKNKNKPTGRSISFFQQLQMILGYPEIRTDLNFINVPTVPLEQRTGFDKINKYEANDNTNDNRRDDVPDGMDISNPCVDI